MRWSRPFARIGLTSRPFLYPGLPMEPALTALWKFWKSPSSFQISRIAYASSWILARRGIVIVLPISLERNVSTGEVRTGRGYSRQGRQIEDAQSIASRFSGLFQAR